MGCSSFVNCSGKMNLVAAPSPSAFNASRYCSVSVLLSMFLATLKILSSASEKPSARNRSLTITFRFQNRRLLLALGDGHGRFPIAQGLGDHGAAAALGGHLPGHRLLHLPRRGDFADFSRRNLDGPALGDLVELCPQHLVGLLPFGQRIVDAVVS